MRPMTTVFAAGLVVALLAASCAHQRPASMPGVITNDSLAALSDSLEIVAYDDLFVQKHARLTEKLLKIPEERTMDPRTIEARSLVAVGEELYLMGKTREAVRLMEEAELLLEQDHPKR